MPDPEPITHYEHFAQFIEAHEPYRSCNLLQKVTVYQQHFGNMIPPFLAELILALHPDADPESNVNSPTESD